MNKIERQVRNIPSNREIIEKIQKTQVELQITVFPFARAGSNKKMAKALSKINDGFKELSLFFLDEDYKENNLEVK